MIELKSPREIKIMAEGGQILAKIFDSISKRELSGLSTEQIDEAISQLISDYRAKPAFLGHNGYPKASCISLNHQVVHGIPNQSIVRPGNLVSIDIGIVWKKFNLDAAITIQIPPTNPEANQLISATKRALDQAIKIARPGKTVNDIAKVITASAQKSGLQIIQGLTGHGIGRRLQEDPIIPNIPLPGKSIKLLPGMVIAIEPMLTTTDGKIITEKDGWTIITRKRGLSAHFEHTVAITAKGNQVLTR